MWATVPTPCKRNLPIAQINTIMEKSLPLILTVTLANLLCFQCTVYNIRRDQRLTLTPLASTTFRQQGSPRGHFGRCTMSCKLTSGCYSVNAQWDSVTSAMTCEFLGKYLHEATSGDLKSASGWVFIQEDPVSVDPSWALAFRGTAGSGQSVWDTWSQDGRHDDADQMKSCLLPALTSSSCQTNFRSYIMDHWTNIDQVRITLHRDNAVAAEMTFNGQGSTRSSWLAIANVLNSPWTDMTPTTSAAYFAVEGLAFVYRRFYLAGFHAGCGGDTGWMVVIDIGQYVSGHCSWDTRHNPGFPVILYSSQPSAVAFDSMTMTADYMLVHVKFLA